MLSRSLILCIGLTAFGADALVEGFRQPPISARPSIYYLLLNGYVNRDYVEKELSEYRKAGVGGLCLFDMGARGPAGTLPPPGPTFLSEESVSDLAHIIGVAGRLGMDVNLSVTSSWDMGGSWVKPEDGSMTLISSETQIAGPREFDGMLPFPAAPKDTPRDANGRPSFFRDVAVLAIPDPHRRSGWEFVYELPNGIPRDVERLALYNTDKDQAKEFTVSVSESGTDSSSFHDLASGALEAR